MKFDTDDTFLNEELVGFRPEIDANQESELLPQDWYEVKVYFPTATTWSTKRTTFERPGRKYFEAFITAQVTQGPFAGWTLRQRISTLPRWRRESTGEELLRALRVNVQDSKRVTQFNLVKALDKALASEPRCMASIFWISKLPKRGSHRSVPIRTSMSHFPDDGYGSKIPEIVAEDGSIVRAYNRVRAWKALGER